MGDEPLSLAEAMELVRGEVARARSRAEALGEELRFTVGTVEVEFLVQITRERGGEGKLTLGVVEAGASGKGTRADTHRVMFSLTPFSTATGRPPTIGDETPQPPPRPSYP
ncbi:trypco2 family protein [Streptosporangium sp. NPDC051023]|uniref:trypco2 family protein n=1 Tax=Streptosporangium sp. NPDC051023 TaxID=3155410 RepID=UPI00344F6298